MIGNFRTVATTWAPAPRIAPRCRPDRFGGAPRRGRKLQTVLRDPRMDLRTDLTHSAYDQEPLGSTGAADRVARPRFHCATAGKIASRAINASRGPGRSAGTAVGRTLGCA